ncbi:MAG: ABC transporter permease [Alphaproteobacteria bacterium]
MSEAASADPARRRRLLLNLLSFSALLLLWAAVTGCAPWPALVSPLFLPSPLAVVDTFATLLQTGYQGKTLGFHLMMSLFRFSVAFLLCIALAVPLGLMMGMSETIRSLCDPPIEITRPMPKLALLPLLIIWFGIGELSKVVIIMLALFPILSISAMQAVRGVGRRKIQAALALGANRRIIFTRVVFPASLPGIFTGIRVSIGLGVTMLVGAEMIATSNGIAWMALSAADFLLTNVVLVGVIIMAVLGYGLDQLARLAESRIVHWSGKDG